MIATLIIYLDFLEKFKRLSDAQFGKLIRLGIEYQKTGIEPDIQDPILALAFDSFKVCIDENNIKYDAKVEARRAAGRKGGIAKAAKLHGGVANVANATFAKQSVANVANVAITKTKTETKTMTKNNTKTKTETDINKTIKAPERFFPDDDLLEDTFAEFVKMRKAIRKPMTDRAKELMVAKLKRMSFDKDIQTKILEQSIKNSWSDIYELKSKGSNSGNNQPQNIFEKYGLTKEDMNA